MTERYSPAEWRLRAEALRARVDEVQAKVADVIRAVADAIGREIDEGTVWDESVWSLARECDDDLAEWAARVPLDAIATHDALTHHLSLLPSTADPQ